jgi:hypothetical protein
MNLEDRLKLILDRPGVPKAVQETLLQDILREIKVYKTPLGAKHGITVLTPEASDVNVKNPGTNPAKPRVL